LLINFHKGSDHDRLLEAAPEYVASLGTDSLDIKAFGAAMQQLGAKMEMGSDDQETTIILTGEEKNLEPTLRLLSHFLGHMKPDKEKLDDLKDAAGPSEKSFWQENTDVFMALMSKVMRGQQSPYLKRLTAKAIKKVSANDLVSSFKQLYDCRCDVSYTGRKPAQEVASTLSALLPQLSGVEDHALEDVVLEVPQDRTVYVFDMPKSRQTLIGLYLPLPSVTSDRERTLLELWGEYFGGDMSSVLFQEVREFRSLAYASQGIASTPSRFNSKNPSGYVALIGTQGDKSMQAIALLDSLLNDMPINSANISVARQSLLNGVNNSYPSFRGKAILVAAQQRYGYTGDANTALVELLPTMTQADVESFYRQQVKDKPYQLMIVGNVKNLDLKALSKYGTVKKVKKDEIYKTKEPKK
jgi:predicted Zn-dependent peptidase